MKKNILVKQTLEITNVKDLSFANDSHLIITELGSDSTRGLSSSEAKNRLQKYGLNKIVAEKVKSIWLILLAQLLNPIVWLLVMAVGLSFYFKEWLDGLVITSVIVINTLIGFYMEFQALKSMNALKKLSRVTAKVIRNGQLIEINSEYVVPGDIVFIEAGDMLPADGRLIKTAQLQIDESALTGESLPVEKQINSLPDDTVLAERTNMLYKGTFSTKGNGYFIVTATGMNTELGNIAQMIQHADQSSTPLKKKLEEFSKKLIWLTAGLVIIIFVAGLIDGQKFVKMLETSIALAVAAIPEGLPVVATMALAQGMLKMAKFNVIVKKLSAVETLGRTNVICTDKTGTLTQNKIEVNTIITAAQSDKAINLMHRIAVLCNTAELEESVNGVKEIGDPLETGLLKFAKKNAIDINEYRKQFRKIKEESFSAETKIMSTLHVNSNEKSIYSKGATEELLKHCTHILHSNGIIELNDKIRYNWVQTAEGLALEGLRVIAGAYKPNASDAPELSKNLVFVGLYGLMDPPRPEVSEAIKECLAAGIKIIMITGDHPATAKNIALKLGMHNNEEIKVITGKEMTHYTQLTEEDKSKWLDTKVFARVSPKQKLDLVKVLQEKKNIVGMTGDGVNDAPALKKADIGIAMGFRGTQVSQEAADMVLKDDSFSSIVIAIKQGRVIFENIRKFVIFLLSCNLSELLVVAIASIFSLHFQLFPIQILFINLITDILPALALGITEGNHQIMQKPPRPITEPIIDKQRWITIFVYAIIISATSIGAVFFSHVTVHKTEIWNPELCNNILFFTLIFSQLLHVFNMGNENSFFKSEIIKNKYVWYSLIISVFMLVAVYIILPIRTILSIYKLTWADWAISISASLLSLILIQLTKKLKIVQQ